MNEFTELIKCLYRFLYRYLTSLALTLRVSEETRHKCLLQAPSLSCTNYVYGSASLHAGMCDLVLLSLGPDVMGRTTSVNFLLVLRLSEFSAFFLCNLFQSVHIMSYTLFLLQ